MARPRSWKTEIISKWIIQLSSSVFFRQEAGRGSFCIFVRATASIDSNNTPIQNKLIGIVYSFFSFIFLLFFILKCVANNDDDGNRKIHSLINISNDLFTLQSKLNLFFLPFLFFFKCLQSKCQLSAHYFNLIDMNKSEEERTLLGVRRVET